VAAQRLEEKISLSRLRRILTLGFLFASVLSFSAARLEQPSTAPLSLKAPAAADSHNDVANEACAKCHRSIYDSYSRTPMAHASGMAADNLTGADFLHQKSAVHFRIYQQDGRVWLDYDRPHDPDLQGKKELLYFIGSGRRGRSYVFSTDHFLFESPINWYTDRHTWDMAPAYGNAREIPMNLPAFASCLHCHVSGMQPPVAGTENLYPEPAFAHPGITCGRCHGSSAAHLQGGAIINPAKLDPQRRDAVCMQCHLEGKAAIERPGQHIYNFRPGDWLSDYIRYFVFAENQNPGLGAVSQFEALAQSLCKKKSGDKMACTSCHDPHSSPSGAERASYFRDKCLACHGSKLGAKHHPEQKDCTSCHMPSSLSTDVAHTEVTDHRILRRPNRSSERFEETNQAAEAPSLVAFPYSQPEKTDTRDLALAWESLAEGGMTVATAKADQLLSSAARESPNDPAVLSALGYVEQKRGAIDRARELYEKALALDPMLVDAATNLGVIKANQGRLPEAVQLWQGAFERSPGKSSIGMNIARAYCGTGKIVDARTYTRRVLEFNPDLSSARSLLQHLNAKPPNCGP
jgi:predicted CXXCH cytochrome family protein